jgi:hypothetical protein
MKKTLLSFLAGAGLMLCPAAAVPVLTDDLFVKNANDGVKLRLRNTTSQTLPWLECVQGNTLKFSLPATGLLPVAYGGTGAATAAAARAALGVSEKTTNSLSLSTNISASAVTATYDNNGYCTNVAVTLATNVFPKVP